MQEVAAPPVCHVGRNRLNSLFCMVLCVTPLCRAETIYTDQNKLFRSARQVTTLGPSLFGDKVNLYNGSLEFVHNDVSLPGNSALSVAVGRRLTTGQEEKEGHFGAWDLDIPHLHGVYSAQRGWLPTSGDPNTRCTSFSKPPAVTGSYGSNSGWDGTEYWHGSFLYVPGNGDQELLRRLPQYTAAPTGNASYSYPIVTRNNWQIRCLPSMDPLSGSTGEAFVAVSPDGTEYRFDWMVSRPLQMLTKASSAPEMSSAPSPMFVASGSTVVANDETVAAIPTDGNASARKDGKSPPAKSIDQSAGKDRVRGSKGSKGSVGDGTVTTMSIDTNALARKEVWILPTKITDRFGNTVTYTYDATNKWQLKTIVANDATGSSRTITLNYFTPGSTASLRVRSVSDGTRTWTYQYGSADGQGPLQSVTLPDNSTWQLGALAPLLQTVYYLGGGNCEVPGMISTEPVTGSLTHPSGAKGEFVLSPVRHGRVGVPNECITYLPQENQTARYPKLFDTFALTKKTITGPGLRPMEWVTTYSAAVSGWAPWNGQNGTKSVEVRDPDGNITRSTFGTVHMQNEGQLQFTEQMDRDRNLLRRTEMRYAEPVSPYGRSDQRRGDGEMSARVIETDRREIVQQGTSFVWEASLFNEFAQPGRIVRTSSLGTRREAMSYENNRAKWVLGQVKTVEELNSENVATGKVPTKNEYDPATANLLKTYSFGLLRKSMSYHADGTLAGEKDGLDHETKYTNYMRGIPQNVSFANGSEISAVVNNLGGIASVTNASGATTSFDYDAMGRFSGINYAAGDQVAWNATTISFNQIWSPEYDLPAGHWRQSITTGAAVETSYFDAFWRPIYTERWDNNDRAGTEQIVKHQYDTEGRSIFESYPVRKYAEIGYGTSRQYDALGRPVLIAADSELGPLRTSYWYSPSVFEKVQTNPRQYATTYRFQAFDQPSEDAITEINAPEGVRVVIARDVYGKALAITRSGGGKSLTRSYVYDSYQRLCKTVEPETGATVEAYDAASNVSWRATGLALPSTTVCDHANVAIAKKTNFSYDLLNRLAATAYGDSSPAILRTYTDDGLLKTISSDGALWTYEYNKRQLNWKEKLTYGGRDYAVERAFDANGSVSQLKYPFDNLTLYYSPNAFGKATQVGAFAQGIKYHPNGALKEFTYGNGIRHELEQNVRGLPARTRDVVSESYVYDANGNPQQIIDHLQASSSRTMTYDGLDRLSTADAPALWGSAAYGYDALDNLISTSLGSGPNARNLIHAFNPTTNRLDSVSGGPAGFNFNYGYDVQGNVTQRGAQSYQFDIGNRLRAATGRGTYTYDGHGRRVNTLGSDGSNTLQIYSQAGQLLYSGPAAGGGTKYIYFNNHQIAEVK